MPPLYINPRRRPMACKDCERRRAQMKEWLTKKAEMAKKWARVRDAKQAADVHPDDTEGAKAPAGKRGQAGKARAQHRKQGLAAPAPIDTGAGRVSLPSVREAGDGQGSAR